MLEQIKKYLRELKSQYFIKKYSLKNIQKPIYFGGNSQISSDLITEPYVFIGKNCNIYPKVTIGAYTMLANDVSIIGDDHNFQISGVPSIFSGRPELKQTFIGRDVWIGAHSIIKTGVKIGDGTIVAAGSVVTKGLEPMCIYGGIPATIIRERFDDELKKNKHLSFLKKDPKTIDETLIKLCNKIG